MSASGFAAAVILSAVLTSLTDWLFTGVLFHESYLAHPEVWRRPSGGAGEATAITWAALIGVITCAAFAGILLVAGATSWPRALLLTVLVFLTAPLPILIVNSLFIKIHWKIVVSHGLGWFVKLAVVAACVALLS